MRSIILPIVVTCLDLILTGCDPVYDVDYEIQNNSNQAISIIVDHPGDAADTNIIADATKLVFASDFGIGFSTEDYLDRLDNLPFEITIQSKSGLPYNKEEEDFSIWNKLYPRKSDNIGKVYLIIHDGDFD